MWRGVAPQQLSRGMMLLCHTLWNCMDGSVLLKVQLLWTPCTVSLFCSRQQFLHLQQPGSHHAGCLKSQAYTVISVTVSVTVITYSVTVTVISVVGQRTRRNSRFRASFSLQHSSTRRTVCSEEQGYAGIRATPLQRGCARHE